jgi:predicted ABC-type ATPase
MKMPAKSKRPCLYIIAGPNGAGKTTFARDFLPRYATCREFVNADLIASGLSPFAPETASFRAARLLLERVHLLAKQQSDFAFETTLSGHTYLPFLKSCKASGYQIHLIFLWLDSVDLALTRIADRVRRGGHNIPEMVVRRRFHKGLRNLFRLYLPVLDSWTLIDNSASQPQTIASQQGAALVILAPETYDRIQKQVKP